MNPRRILRRSRRRGYLELTCQVYDRLFSKRSRQFPLSVRWRSLLRRWLRECEHAGKIAVVATEVFSGTWEVDTFHPNRDVSHAAYIVETRLPVTTLEDVRRVVRELQDVEEVVKFAAVLEVNKQ